jgi:hypothetical protein
MREAGTYLVVTNPSSFASLPEYCSGEPTSSLLAPDMFNSCARIPRAQQNFDTQFATEEPHDPNIIILKTFEDYQRRSPVSTIVNLGPVFATSSPPPTALETLVQSIHFSGHSSNSGLSKLDEARRGGRDAHLLKHYRSHISGHVIKVGSREVEEDIFEIQARTFPPVSVPHYTAAGMTYDCT